MTVEPTHGSDEYPNANCPIHEAALDEIKKIVLETREEVRALKEIGGPIVTLDKRIDKVDGKADRANERVDDVITDVNEAQNDIKELKREQNKLIVKVAVIVTVISTAANFGIAEFFR